MDIKIICAALTAFSFLLVSSNALADDDWLEANNTSYYDNYYDTASYSEPQYNDDGYNYAYRSRSSYQYEYDDDEQPVRRSSRKSSSGGSGGYASRLPQSISSQSDTIVVDPRVHAWGAYRDGQLVKAGLATAGGRYCSDIRRPCKTRSGVFTIQSLGSASCKSTRYPLGKGGAPMPYCMYFNGNQGLHGSYQVFEGNGSHGCVRMTVSDAAWVRFNFATIGTKVIVKPY